MGLYLVSLFFLPSFLLSPFVSLFLLPSRIDFVTVEEATVLLEFYIDSWPPSLGRVQACALDAAPIVEGHTYFVEIVRLDHGAVHVGHKACVFLDVFVLLNDRLVALEEVLVKFFSIFLV